MAKKPTRPPAGSIKPDPPTAPPQGGSGTANRDPKVMRCTFNNPPKKTSNKMNHYIIRLSTEDNKHTEYDILEMIETRLARDLNSKAYVLIEKCEGFTEEGDIPPTIQEESEATKFIHRAKL